MTFRHMLALCGLILGVLALALPALADSHGGKHAGKHGGKHGDPASPNAPSAEDRAKMADAHQKMAECLRSTRPIQECRAEMKKTHDGWAHAMTCPHGESCPHGEACPHGDACDGNCKHHGAHDAMGENGKGAKAPKSDAAKPKAP